MKVFNSYWVPRSDRNSAYWITIKHEKVSNGDAKKKHIAIATHPVVHCHTGLLDGVSWPSDTLMP